MKNLALSLLASLLLSNQSQAVVSLISISGSSAQNLSNPQAPVIYAGFTTGCTGDGSHTCDSCTGEVNSGSKLWSCNKRNAYPGLILTIRMRSTLRGATAENAVIKIGGEKYIPSISPTFADGILSIQLPWSEICNSPTVNKGALCDGGSFSTNLEVGFEINTKRYGTIEDTLSFLIRTRVASSDESDWFYTDCSATSTFGSGACHFKVVPGDRKIYADNLTVSEGYPATITSGVNFKKIVFFYEKAAHGEDDTATLGKISNKSPMVSLSVNMETYPPIMDNRITGLTNGVRYCMVMANQDATGIISSYTPLPGTPGSPVTTSQLCTVPTRAR